MKTRVWLAFAACLLAVTLLLPGAALGHKGPATVRVTIKEWTFTPSVPSVGPGKVTFVVRNAGTMEHEFVVLRSNLPPLRLPMEGNQAKEIGMRGEIEEFGPGLTKRLTLTLKRGKYVLLCNLPGHYNKGQAVRLIVR